MAQIRRTSKQRVETDAPRAPFELESIDFSVFSVYLLLSCSRRDRKRARSLAHNLGYAVSAYLHSTKPSA